MDNASVRRFDVLPGWWIVVEHDVSSTYLHSDSACVVLSMREWRNYRLHAERNAQRIRNCRGCWHFWTDMSLRFGRHVLPRYGTHGFLFSLFFLFPSRISNGKRGKCVNSMGRLFADYVPLIANWSGRLLQLAKPHLSHGANAVVSHAREADQIALARYRHTYTVHTKLEIIL